MLLPLTENQITVFKEICAFISTHNYPPTIPEIQELCSVKNPGTVHSFMKAFEKKGYVIRRKGIHRGLDLTEEARRKYLQ